MRDYSLHNLASRPAKVGDKLTTRDSLVPVPADSLPQKMPEFAFRQEPNWHSPRLSRTYQAACWVGGGKKSFTKRRFFGRSTESVRRRIMTRWSFQTVKSFS